MAEHDRVVTRVASPRADDAVDVLCDAFNGYPAMDFIVPPDAPDYRRLLRTLISFFVAARFQRGEPVLGIEEGEELVAAALVTLPGERPSPPELARRREAVWLQLGTAARERYERMGEAFARFAIPDPHHHLNMIGVRRSHAGRGLARPLLEEVHRLAADDPDSTGVTLNTEDPRNRSLYEHFGYRLLGHVVVADNLETWGYFRPAVRPEPTGSPPQS